MWEKCSSPLDGDGDEVWIESAESTLLVGASEFWRQKDLKPPTSMWPFLKGRLGLSYRKFLVETR